GPAGPFVAGGHPDAAGGPAVAVGHADRALLVPGGDEAHAVSVHQRLNHSVIAASQHAEHDLDTFRRHRRGHRLETAHSDLLGLRERPPDDLAGLRAGERLNERVRPGYL